MVNSQVVAETVNALKITQQEAIPNPIPVVEVGLKSVKSSRTAYVNSTSTATTTILAANAHPDHDVYINSAILSYHKDAGSAATSVGIRVIINGQSQFIARLESIASTANSDSIAVSFPHPVKIDTNTAVSLISSASAVISAVGCITYFVDEVN